MPTALFTNTDNGPRGLNSTDGLVMVGPGETAELELSLSEFDDLPAHFAIEGAVGLAASDDGLDDMTVAALDAVISAEKVAVPETGTGNEGRVVKVDKVAAIRAHRAAPPAPAADGLDDMDYETLRSTVQAVTGKEPPADADRAALLALART